MTEKGATMSKIETAIWAAYYAVMLAAVMIAIA
jgi:hypothetical protein